ncbi:MAG: serine/threonine-protein kinase, partial [Planctomycetota bacterium]
MTENRTEIPVESDTDELLGQILDQLTEQLRRGETIDLAAYEREFPNQIEEIRCLLPTLKTMVGLGCSSFDRKEVNDRTEADLTKEKRLGDFILFDEIGRGGMGVVYEAEQVSMNRRVALKVLPFASLLDEKAITRFQNEARAAGTLEHPNIVPVYAVGKEHGVYYYAMSLINGLSLAEMIAQLRTRLPSNDPPPSIGSIVADSCEPANVTRLDPTIELENRDEASVASATDTVPTLQAELATYASRLGSEYFKQIATLGIQAAEALDFAHQHGIIHRDVKPGNLMVDGGGKLWVTDFGLARIESDAGMTATGDILGTLRYMSPEQALVKRSVVDQRSDVYSLGATLYEMLALRPVFDGGSREALLKQLTFDEPRRLRDCNPAIPVDLETIILKSIAKEPSERYASAAELAEDLRRQLEHRPIKARPATLPQRMTKFARRHPAWFLSASVFSVLCLIVVSAFSVRLSAAFENVTVEKRIADENFELAVSTVERFSNTILQETEIDSRLRKKLLEHSLEYFNVFVSKRGDDEDLQVQLASAYWNIGL